MATRLFIIDDDQELTGLLRELLRQEGFDVETHSGGPDAAARAISGDYALMILDVMLPYDAGFAITRGARPEPDR